MTDGKDPGTGQFTEGNTWWRKSLNAFGKRGPLPTYTDPQELLDDAAEYFADIYENPLFEEKVFSDAQGVASVDPYTGKILPKVIVHNSPRARIMTISGLCNHLGISRATWKRWRNEQEHLQPAIEFIEQIMDQQKMELAASGLAKDSFVARLMGLADEQRITGPDGGPLKVETDDWSDMEIARRIAFTMAKAIEKQRATEEQTDGDSETQQQSE